MTDHVCPGRDCDRQVSFDVLACRKHWGRISQPTKHAVLTAWRTDPLGADYLAARAAAVKEMR